MAHVVRYSRIAGPTKIPMDHCLMVSHNERIYFEEQVHLLSMRKKTHCPIGHEYEVRMRKNRPVRWCRTCHNAQRRNNR